MYEIKADGKLLFSTDVLDDETDYILSPTIDFEIGKAGACKFTVLPGHPVYDYLTPLVTMIEAYNDDSMIFRGRVLSYDIDFYNQKQVTCEGDLVFLKDGAVNPGKYNETIRQLFTRYINEHNNRVENYQKFVVGEVTVDGADTVTIDTEKSSFRNTDSAITSDIVDPYGGYLRTRTVNGVTYIDYLKEYGRVSGQTIEFGENLLDFENEASGEDIFTVLIPIGNDDLTISSVNGGKDYIEIEEGIQRYGTRVIKIESFETSDANKLLQNGRDYIARNYDSSPSTLTIKAVDLKELGVNPDSIRVGDSVRIISEPHRVDKDYICTNATYDLLNPGATSYTFGKPKQEMSGRYAKDKRTTESAQDSTNSRVSGNRSASSKNTEAIEELQKEYKFEVVRKGSVLEGRPDVVNALYVGEDKVSISASEMTFLGLGEGKVASVETMITEQQKAIVEIKASDLFSVEAELISMKSELYSIQSKLVDISGALNVGESVVVNKALVVGGGIMTHGGSITINGVYGMGSEGILNCSAITIDGTRYKKEDITYYSDTSGGTATVGLLVV